MALWANHGVFEALMFHGGISFMEIEYGYITFEAHLICSSTVFLKIRKILSRCSILSRGWRHLLARTFIVARWS